MAFPLLKDLYTMKRLFIIILIASKLFFLLPGARAIGADTDTARSSTGCLKISFRPVWDHAQPQEAVVRLYSNTRQTERTDSVKAEVKTFMLEKNREYVLEIISQGYITKRVLISTHVPAGVPLDEPFSYDFEIDMHPLPGAVQRPAAVLPVAYISYSYTEECFLHDWRYALAAKRKLRDLQKEK
jgi:hypothetical protein